MLIRKMLRDMKINTAQFISIFILTLLGVYIYSGISSEWYGLKVTAENFYNETHMADLWIYGSGFSEEEAQAVNEVTGVTDVERRLTLNSVGDFENAPTIQLHFVESNKISKFELMEGEAFSLEKEGIWLDHQFAEAKDLTVGDYITLSIYGYELSKEVKGLVISPEYVYSAGDEDIITQQGSFGYGFLSYHSYPEELPMIYSSLLVTTEHTPDNNMETAIDKALDGKYSAYLERKNMRSYMQFNEEMKEHKAMGEIFPIVFLAVATLTIVTTMARLVNNQRTQIGILKSIGFPRRRILFHYISYGLFVSLSGSVIGTVLGPLTLPYLFYGPMKTAYNLPEWKAEIPSSVYIMAVLAVLLSIVVTYFTCQNVLKDTPSETLRPKAPRDIKHSLIDRLPFWRKLSFDIQWNLRDIFRCKGRSLMAIIGVLGCSALLICAFGMKDTVDYILEWNYDVLNRYETRFELESSSTKEQKSMIITEYNGEEIWEGTVELKAANLKKSGELLVIDKNTLIQFVDKENISLELPRDQLSISYKIAEQLKLKVGDRVSWHLYGEEEWNTSIVGAIYRTPFTQGITLSREYYESCGYTFISSTILSAEEISEQIMDTELAGVSKIQRKQTLIESYQNMMEAMDLLVYVLVIAAVILAAVVIYNLGILSFTEHQREMSTLKVIGFKTSKLRYLLLTQNIWLTAVGILPGIIIGIWILSYIFRFVGDVFDFIIVIDLSSYLYCIAGTFLITIVMNRIFSKRVKKIDMVSSLKGVE